MARNDRIRGAQSIMGYEFNDPSHLDEALHLAGSGGRPDGNKCMAQIGDCCIRMILAVKGYQRGDPPGTCPWKLELIPVDINHCAFRRHRRNVTEIRY